MNLLEKLKENQFVVICIVCAIVIPISVSVTTWFNEQQKELIRLKQEINEAKAKAEIDRCKNKISDLESMVKNYNNTTLKATFNKSTRIFVGQGGEVRPPVILDKIDQKIEIPDNSNNEVEDEIKYSHVIFVDGADGISLRNRSLNPKELSELESGKSKGDATYVETLMNSHLRCTRFFLFAPFYHSPIRVPSRVFAA